MFWANGLQTRSSVEVSVLVGYDATSPDNLLFKGQKF